MRIGVLTIFGVPNYGAILQSYALSRYLLDKGFETHVVNYRPPAIKQLYAFKLSFPPNFWHWLRLRRCARFVEGCLPLDGREKSLAELTSKISSFDTLIAGSDQVWFTGPVQYYEPAFFLDFPAFSGRRISYAASAGGSTTFQPFMEQVSQALARFNHVGVRDSHTASLVQSVTPTPLTENVDPVFLSTFDELIARESPHSEPYILLFGNFSGASAELVTRVATATGIKSVVSLQYQCPTATHRVPSPCPKQWLSWFKHSAFVITSYFHGAAIAVKFNRPFLAIPTPGRRLKVNTMLEPLGLAERCLSDPLAPEAGEIAKRKINWVEANARLQLKIQESEEYLKRALA